MGFYDFEVKDAKGGVVSLRKFEGKVVVIVNTATQCGFTPQYEGLQNLYDELGERGFEILDFPCNQFGKQAPGSNEEIGEFCEVKYHTTFPRFDKIDVNGKNESPLYAFLKSQQGGKLGSAIKWNFTKFLIDREGNVVARFGSATKPEDIKPKIEKLLLK